jgi:O-antigen/teichoic acid export membrane protein
VLHLVLSVAGTLTLSWAAHLTPWSAWLVLGAGACVVATVLGFAFQLPSFGSVPSSLLRMVIGDHWRYGRWAIGSNLVGFVPGGIYYLVLPVWHGLEASGALKAVMNFGAPVAQASAAVSAVLLPLLARGREGRAFGSILELAVKVFVMAAGAYWILLGLGGSWLTTLFYGQGAYARYVRLLWVVGATPLLYGLGALWGAGIRALERPQYIFWGTVGSAVFAVTVGLWMAAQWSVPGAVAATAVGYGVMTVSNGTTLRAMRRGDL